VIDIDAALREGIASGAYSWDEGKYLNGAGYEALAQAIERQIGKPHQNHAADKEDALEVSDYYKHRVSVFRSLPETENQIIMLGNSLINNGPWAELFPLGLVVNRGISGDVAMGVDQRLEEIVADKPSKIFLITGTNDLINEPELPAIKLWDRYEKLIKDIREQLPETELYVQSMLPLNPKTKFYAGFNDRAAELNKLLDAGAGRYGYYFIDIASKMTDENGDLQEECTTDGIHLSAIGYFKWAAELARGNRMMHSLKNNLPKL
jgi:lysophospholipase L1-like esterase